MTSSCFTKIVGYNPLLLPTTNQYQSQLSTTIINHHYQPPTNHVIAVAVGYRRLLEMLVLISHEIPGSLARPSRQPRNHHGSVAGEATRSFAGQVDVGWWAGRFDDFVDWDWWLILPWLRIWPLAPRHSIAVWATARYSEANNQAGESRLWCMVCWLTLVVNIGG